MNKIINFKLITTYGYQIGEMKRMAIRRMRANSYTLQEIADSPYIKVWKDLFDLITTYCYPGCEEETMSTQAFHFHLDKLQSDSSDYDHLEESIAILKLLAPLA